VKKALLISLLLPLAACEAPECEFLNDCPLQQQCQDGACVPVGDVGIIDQPPVAAGGIRSVAVVETVNGVASTAGQSARVRPLDDVVLSGLGSVPENSGGSITAYSWTLVSQPADSTVVLSTPTAARTAFEFNSSGAAVSGIDVVGIYEVRLQVTDDTGLRSSNNAQVTLNALPDDAFHVQLTWDSPANDVDLHVKKDPGTYCGDDSCYYGNCRAGGFGRPDFDGVGDANTAGDPVLDIDDLDGFGPENIVIAEPADGTYNIGVHMFTFDENTTATVKLFVDGDLEEELSQLLTVDDEYWEILRIDWSSGSADITVIDALQNGGICGE
jgi:hypothetical protein